MAEMHFLNLYRPTLGCCLALLVEAGLSERLEYKGMSYEVISDRRLPWKEARDRCKQEGGQLAKVTENMLPTNQRDPFFNLTWTWVQMRLPCLWIGMSDFKEEGNWVWLDGSPVGFDTIREADTGFSGWLMPTLYDCGALCRKTGTEDVEWSATNCYYKHIALCQYVSRPRRRTRRPKVEANLVHKIRTDVFLKADPILHTRVTMVTMCYRVCKNRCNYFNYNMVTKVCRGFTGICLNDGGFEKAELGWGVWQIVDPCPFRSD